MGAGYMPPVDGAAFSMMSHKLFGKLDRDHDRRLTQQEVRDSGVLRKTGLSKSDEEEETQFKAMDTNRDGYVSEAESTIFFSQAMAGSGRVAAAIAMMIAEYDPEAEEAEPKPEELGARAKADEASYAAEAKGEAGGKVSMKA